MWVECYEGAEMKVDKGADRETASFILKKKGVKVIALKNLINWQQK